MGDDSKPDTQQPARPVAEQPPVQPVLKAAPVPVADKENAAPPAWASAEVGPTSGRSEIRVAVSFVEALQSSDVDVDIAATSVRLRGPAEEVLEVPLPASVDPSNAVAKFSSKKRQLTLLLPLA